MTVTELPKIELHLHHEGAAPPAFIRQLAHEKRVDLSGIFKPDGSYDFRGFAHFLEVYEAACEVLKSPEDFRRLTLAILEESAANGVVYSETFLSPDFCGGGDLHAWRDYLNAIQDAADEAERKLGITLRGVVTCVRHFGPEQAKASARCAAETAGDWITGFGMGGNEGVGRQGDFAWAFDCAREAGLRLTTHAGEFGGPDSVREAVRELGVERIGHGVRAIEDPDLVHELADRGVTLEVCPGSNVVLGLYDDFASHPIAKLRDAGVKVSVSTDDPPFFHTTMRREYEMLHKAFGWQAEDFAAINETALSAAFCDEETRARVKKRLEKT
ncbi:adenosine deaminase [Ruegeria marisrubri]|uniref:Adenosine deaminase n=1 Tax=Ruegeria marisrubri TaxID=1685379 RepID=A0A117KGZ2_9RHOB|nr:adenosine deaminase [Ruegeria marisrubri]KUJ85516.1 adenosine deaminase [Ruegeria marisrubri]